MTLISLPFGASNSGTNDWSDVHDNDNAIVTVVNGDIRNDNIAAAGTANIAHNKLANTTAGYILIGNASGAITGTVVSGDVTINSSGVTAIGSSKVTSAMIVDGTIVAGDVANATLTDAKLASPNNSTYKTLANITSGMDRDAAAATYMLRDTDAASASPATSSLSTTCFTVIRYVTTDYAVNGLTTKLNLRTIVSPNATAPGTMTFVFGLYPVTVAGAADNLTFTLGSVVAGSTSTHTNPTNSVHDHATSGDFDEPANGTYAIGCVTNATLANNSAVQLHAALRVRNV